MDYTEGELWIHLRRERAALTAERAALARRLAEVIARLEELDTAEDILEGGL